MKPTPTKQGSWRKIFELFIAPFFKYRINDQGVQDFLDSLWGTHRVVIHKYVLTEPYTPQTALRKITEGNKLPDTPFPAGTVFFVRRDVRLPHHFDVEFQTETGAFWYVLNRNLWTNLLEYCRASPFNQGRREKTSWEDYL